MPKSHSKVNYRLIIMAFKTHDNTAIRNMIYKNNIIEVIEIQSKGNNTNSAHRCLVN